MTEYQLVATILGHKFDKRILFVPLLCSIRRIQKKKIDCTWLIAQLLNSIDCLRQLIRIIMMNMNVNHKNLM